MASCPARLLLKPSPCRRSAPIAGGLFDNGDVAERHALAAALAALAAGAALGGWALLLEPRRLVVRRLRVELEGWPRELDGLRIGIAADFHAGGPHVDERTVERAVERLNGERPDVVALLGDYADPEAAGRRIEPEAVAERLGALRAPLGVFAVLGNHDWQTDGPRTAAALDGAGIAVLENESVALERDGARAWLIGLADSAVRAPRFDPPLDELPDGEPAIALTHNPDLWPAIPRRIALTVAGHLHGGQVNLPFVRGAATPSRYGARFAAGLFERDGGRLFVTAGIGTRGPPLRFGVPPEVVVLELRSG